MLKVGRLYKDRCNMVHLVLYYVTQPERSDTEKPWNYAVTTIGIEDERSIRVGGRRLIHTRPYVYHRSGRYYKERNHRRDLLASVTDDSIMHDPEIRAVIIEEGRSFLRCVKCPLEGTQIHKAMSIHYGPEWMNE